jgi:hypothetical protein
MIVGGSWIGGSGFSAKFRGEAAAALEEEEEEVLRDLVMKKRRFWSCFGGRTLVAMKGGRDLRLSFFEVLGYGGLYRNCIFTAIYDFIKKVKIDLKNKYFQFFYFNKYFYCKSHIGRSIILIFTDYFLN